MFTSQINPYVYLCVNKKTGEYYYGYRRANRVNAIYDLGIKYYTSSNKIMKNVNEFNFFIIAEFIDANDAYVFEQSLIFNSWKDPLLLNRHFTKGNTICFSRYERTMEIREKIAKGNRKTYEEKYGIDRAKHMKELISNQTRGENNPTYKIRKGKPMREWFNEKAIENHRKQTSRAHSGKNNVHARKFLIVFNDGTMEYIHGTLNDFCERNNFKYSTLYSAIGKGPIPKISNKARFKSLKDRQSRERMIGISISYNDE